jgi:hypothetical protein
VSYAAEQQAFQQQLEAERQVRYGDINPIGADMFEGIIEITDQAEQVRNETFYRMKMGVNADVQQAR